MNALTGSGQNPKPPNGRTFEATQVQTQHPFDEPDDEAQPLPIGTASPFGRERVQPW